MSGASRKSGIAFRRLMLLGGVGLIFLLLAPAVSADFTFCDFGSGASQCSNPDGIALERETGTLFVADSGNRRIGVFAADGTFQRAFGWDVIPDGQPGDIGTGLEVCTAATTCKAGSAGAGAGQFGGGLTTITIDSGPTPWVYLMDRTNNRVQKFTPAGEFVLTFGGGVNQTTGGNICTAASGDTCGAGTNGKGTGEFFWFASFPVLVGVGPGGVIYVADSPMKGTKETDGFDNRVQLFEPDGSFLKECPLAEDNEKNIVALTVDHSSGDFYASTRGNLGVRKYDTSCAFLTTVHESSEVRGALAVDDEGNLFVADPSSFPQDPEELGGETAIYEYDSSSARVRVLYGNGTLKSRLISLAPYSTATGDVFVIENSSPRRLAHIAFPPPGPVVVPETTKAPNPRSARATLESRVNPEGKATTYHFEYVDQQGFEDQSGFEGPATQVTPEVALGSDFKARLAKQEVTGLAPETTYRFRVIATNVDAPPGGIKGFEGSFTTLAPIEVLAAWATRVSTDSARLNAEINPLGTAATGFFEYLDLQSFEEQGGFEGPATQTTATLDFGEGEEPLVRSAQLFPLEPDTAYRFRLIAQNHCKPDPEVICTFTGEVRGFKTFPLAADPKACPNEAFRTGAGAALPDCRAYEMVSPLDKANGDIFSLRELTLTSLGNARAHVNQATPQGDALTYSAFRAFGDAISTPYSSQYIARRDPTAGWSSHSLNPPREVPSLYLGAFAESLYKGFSEDLCQAYLIQDTDIALEAGAPAGVPNLYRRHNCGEDRYELITTVAPTEPAPGFSRELELESRYFPTIQGFSADGSAAAFKAPAKLAPEGSEEDIYQAYLHKDGELYLVSVLPDGKAADTHASVGTALGSAGKRVFDSVVGAVSEDGERVFWSAETDEPSTPVHGGGAAVGFGGSALYLRLNATEEQSALASATGTGKLSSSSNPNVITSLIAARGKGAISTGSPTVNLSEVSIGQFIAGQPVSGTGIPAGTTILEVSGSTLTLSANATATNASVTLTSEGPMPFAVGQPISATGIPPQTRITAVAQGSLTLSKAATESKNNVPLTATIGCTEADKACSIAVSEGEARFIAANPDATQALYLEDGDLFEFDVAKAIAKEAGARTLIASEVPGVVGASEDLSRVYFPSEQVCSGEESNSEGDKAQAGEPNLYLYQAGEECGAGEFEFVGTMGDGDRLSWAPSPVDRKSRVSSDGLHATFIARTPLTGYDNTDSGSGERSAEVFLYDASEAGLACVSCNPSGGRPEGARNLSGGGEPGESPRFFFAAKIPGWETQWQASRVLSEDGERLFFESYEALVLRDTNGKQDVYEWQRAQSKAECNEAGADLYVEEANGCLSLISSGQSDEDSEFIDASANGRDVFFTTASSLVPQDYGLVDVYDARIGGGFPSPIVDPGQPCEGEACQSPPPAPEDPTPSSSTYEGQGNLKDAKPKPRACPKGKRRVRKAGKARCVKKKAPRRQRRGAGR